MERREQGRKRTGEGGSGPAGSEHPRSEAEYPLVPNPHPPARDPQPLSANPQPPTPIPLLIVNADDFGISEGVNRGIAEAHRRGILTSATVMANMPAFDHAVRTWKENPTLAVGVHLSLTAGAPVLPSSRVPSLVDREGRFLRADRLLAALSLGRVDPRQVDAELIAQVERAIQAGLSPTHLDSHHHLHIHPSLQPIVVRIALVHGIRGIRCPVELGPVGHRRPRTADRGREDGGTGGWGDGGTGVRSARCEVRSAESEPGTQNPEPRTQNSLGTQDPGLRSQPLTPRPFLTALVVSVLGTLLRRRARSAGLVTPDHFRGTILGPAFSAEALHRVLWRLPAGSTELMCHPGYPDPELSRRTAYAAGREEELRALLDPACREILERAGMRLGSYCTLSR